MSIPCKHCGKLALTQAEFEQKCSTAGLLLLDGNLYGGLSDQNSVTKYREFEDRKGFSCSSCGSTYCMKCLLAVAPAKPQGGKSCPNCRGDFRRLI